MPVIVDGDNLLGSWPGHSRSDDERRNLAVRLAALSRESGKRILLFFDGPSLAVNLGPDVRFSGPGRRADDLILKHVGDSKDRRGFLVVTNDRSLADRCRWLGAKVERCDVFRKRLVAAERTEPRPEPDDVEYWLRIFGD